MQSSKISHATKLHKQYIIYQHTYMLYYTLYINMIVSNTGIGILKHPDVLI